MSVGSDLLNIGWVLDLEHHKTVVTYTAAGLAPVPLSVLMSQPADVVNFGRPVNGASWFLVATAGELPYAVDDAVEIGADRYRVLAVDNPDGSNISVRLAIGKTSLAGRQ